jgi:hypothetical protein
MYIDLLCEVIPKELFQIYVVFSKLPKEEWKLTESQTKWTEQLIQDLNINHKS